MKEIYLHIGLGKTGSTTIQESLRLNSERLNKQGYLNIDLHNIRNLHTDSVLYHLILCDLEITGFWGEWMKKIISEKEHLLPLEKAFSELTSSSPDKIVISDEFYNRKSILRLIQFCNNSNEFNLNKIIMYIRRQDKWYDSLKNQIVKSGQTKDLSMDTLKYGVYIGYIKAFIEKYSPATELVVRNFDLVVKKSSLVKDFYDCIGVHDFLPLKSVKNSSLNAELLLLINTYMTDEIIPQKADDFFRFKWTLLKHLSDEQGDRVTFLKKQDRIDLLNEFYKHNKSIFSEFNMGTDAEFEEWMLLREENDDVIFFDPDDPELNRSLIRMLYKKILEDHPSPYSSDNWEVIVNSLLNIIRMNKGNMLYLYGAGEHTIELLKRVEDKSLISGIVDSFSSLDNLFGIPVYKSDYFNYSLIDTVIISSKAFEKEIYNELQGKVSEEKIFTLYTPCNL